MIFVLLLISCSFILVIWHYFHAKRVSLESGRKLFNKNALKLQLYLERYISAPCTRCGESKFILIEVSPNGRSIHVECCHCNKKIRFKASPGKDTKDVADWWEAMLKQKTSLDKLADSCLCVGEHLIRFSIEDDSS